MHSILFITRIFPPAGGSAVQAPAKLAKYLPSSGIMPHIVTGPPINALEDGSLLSEIPGNVPVHRAFTFEPAVLELYLEGKCKTGNLFGLFLKIVLKCYSVVYYRIAFPDLFVGWVPFGFIKCLSLIGKNRLELIYVNGQPPSSMLMGYYLKKIFKIPLVIDYTDPWMATPGYYPGKGLTGRLSRVLEKKFLKAADLVAYCKQSIYDDIIASYPGQNPKKYVFIPLGFDPADFSPSPVIRSDKKFRIVYTGKLTKNFCYSPRSFFQALHDLIESGKITPDMLEVVCAGIAIPEYLALIGEMELEPLVKHIGYIDHKESIALIRSSDALLLLMESEKGTKASGSFSGSLPAKTFEYMNTGRPILAIIPKGFEYDLLQKSNLGFFAEPNDPESVEKAIENLLRNHGPDKNGPPPDWEYIHTFDRKNIVEKQAGHLLRLITQKQLSVFT